MVIVQESASNICRREINVIKQILIENGFYVKELDLYLILSEDEREWLYYNVLDKIVIHGSVENNMPIAELLEQNGYEVIINY
jgi:hypothetical protein